MAHRIASNDGAIFYSEPAWHGKGAVLKDAPNPTQAMILAGHDWVAQKHIGLNIGRSIMVDPAKGLPARSVYPSTDEYCAIVNSKTGEILSVQSARYEPIQYSEVYELAYALGSDVKVESAFSMDGERRLAVLLRGDTFAPSNSKHDRIHRYVALMSSHDGTYSLMVVPTSVRVQCHNTATQAIGEARKAKRMLSVRHKGDIGMKLLSVEKALHRYRSDGVLFEKAVNAMSNKTMTVEDVQRFWVDVYGMLFQPIVPHPRTQEEAENNAEAVVRIAHWSDTFDHERASLSAPASLWQAANAVTHDIQHGKRRKSGDINGRAFSNLIGAGQDETMTVLNYAASLV